MAQIRLTARARADLDEIWLHVASDNPAAADRLIDRIVARCQRLADHLELGPARPDIAPDARVLVAGDYLALYRIDGSTAQIVRIVHGARQMKALFDLGPEAGGVARQARPRRLSSSVASTRP